jgi:hypothetical protein
MEEESTASVPGARPVEEVLRSDPFFAILGSRLANPIVLGFVIAVLIVVTIVLGPSTESRFIYTDF